MVKILTSTSYKSIFGMFKKNKSKQMIHVKRLHKVVELIMEHNEVT